jgi:hypothetical protein
VPLDQQLPGDIIFSWRLASDAPHAFSIAASGSGSASRWSVPTSTSADAASPLLRTNSALSANGTTSSAPLCRITVPCFTVFAVPPLLPRRTEEDEFRLAAVDVHGDGSAPRRADDYSRLVLVELGLSDPDRLVEILVGQFRIDDLMAVLDQESRFDAARDRVPSMQEENLHEVVVAGCGQPGRACRSSEE